MRSRSLIVLAVVAVVLGAFIFFFERDQPTTDERAERADRVFANLPTDEVVSVRLRVSDGVVVLTKDGDDWRLTEPLDYPADGVAVQSLLQAFANLDAERTLAAGEVDPADYGLQEAPLEAVLTTADGDQFALEVGDELPLGARRAVRRQGEDEILLCAGGFVAHLDRTIDDWRSRDVVDVLERDLASVEITTAEDRIVAVRSGKLWQLQSPLTDLADGEQMRSLVSELNALRITEFLPAETDPATLGLDAPEFRIVLTHADEAAQVTLELAPPDEESSTVAVRRNGGELFRMPDTIRPRLAKAPVLWRSDKVWPFSSWDAGTLEISSGDSKAVLQRADDEEFGKVWRFDDGTLADDANVRRRLTALADLEVREHDLVVPPTPVMGSVILVLDDDAGAEGVTFTFYEPLEDGGHAAVTVSTRADVMGIDAASAETILSDLDALRSPPEVNDDSELPEE